MKFIRLRKGVLLQSGILCIVLCMAGFNLSAQAQSTGSLHGSGYIQGSPLRFSATLPGVDEEQVWWEYRLQQRLNLAWQPTSALTMHWQMRTRFFAGDLVRENPGYSDLIHQENGLIGLAGQLAERDSWMLHYMTDRLYAEWDHGAWNVRAGRQRINWGVNLISNPNDLFNLYSFYDFDYPERPGSDAIRIQRHLGFNSRVEVAVSPSRDPDQHVAALLYAFGWRGTDLQVLGGYYRERFVAGAGFASDIRGAGWKGEMTFYTGNGERASTWIAATSVEYMFTNGVFAVVEGMYNHSGGSDGFALLGTALRPDNPSLTRYQVTAQARYPIHPLVDGSLAAVWYPDERGAFVSPALMWSAGQNLDVQVLAQVFAGSGDSVFADAGRLVTASVTWSF